MYNAQLIKKLREGDHHAYKFIFDHHYALMGASGYEYVEDYYISQNIVEDVMMSIWEKREQLIISTSVKSYLLTSVHNKCIDYLRSRSREAEVFSLESEIGSSSCYIPDQEMFEQIVSSELEKKIEEIIQSMPEECKKVFLLSRYGNKSYAEIANELNISVNTVKYHIKKALSLFREELKDYLLTITALYFYLFNQ